MKPMLKAPGTRRLKLNVDKLLSSFAFNVNMRRYIKETRGVLLASEKATPSSAEFQVAIAGNGECSMTPASGFAASTANIVSYLRFEEGPCDADADKDAERERVVLDRSKPEHAMACSAKTFGTHGVDATVYRYPVVDHQFPKNVAVNKKLTADASGAALKGPGHSGNFFMEFVNEVMLNNSGVISYRVDGYLVSQDLPDDLSDSATVSAWLAHPGRAVHADGETLFSWIPKGVIASGAKQPARQFLDVALMPFGVLRFRSVYTVGWCRLTLSKPTFEAPGYERLKLKCDDLLSRFAFKFNLRR